MLFSFGINVSDSDSMQSDSDCATLSNDSEIEEVHVAWCKTSLAAKQALVRGIVKDFPEIGKTIEEFVQERNIGADHWRRTGVLTFDGNTSVQQTVTYQRSREHLEERYKRKFSYGTVIQLCVARNRRRRSAKRYKGVARVTSRRTRKGFQLKFNPDAHWSSALVSQATPIALRRKGLVTSCTKLSPRTVECGPITVQYSVT